MAGGSGGQIKGKIGDVAQPPPLDHDGQHLAGLALAEGADRLDQLLHGEVIDAVDVARAQSHGGEAAGQRLAGDDGDMGHPPLAAADQVQRLGARILRPVGPDGLFAGYIGMEDGLAIVGAKLESPDFVETCTKEALCGLYSSLEPSSTSCMKPVFFIEQYLF